MRKGLWRVWLGLGLAALSGVLFYVHYLIFHDLHHLGIYTMHDIAFLPLEVLIVTLLLHTMLEWREHQELLQKLNMVIGAFFSEVGGELIERLSAFDTRPDVLHERYEVTTDWTDEQLKRASADAIQRSFDLKPTRDGTTDLRDFMIAKRQFLLRLLENQNLLENERFTEVLWAVFHLGDELQRRTDMAASPDSDMAHLAGDMERAYGRLVAEWFEHLRHLKVRYPYLYALAVRANPMTLEGQIEVLG
ncbi:MAG: hypothetical protein OEV43_06055 [Coriobacteriia bacterium]|nr:hypothetical protein [Coriobacteriia bacterium]